MTEKTIVKVAMNGQGVLSRRGFLRGVGLGAAGLSAVSFTDLMALQADELRKRQMSCILLWMAGGPSQFETFDPKPGHENGGETKAIETAVPGIQIAEDWEQTAKVMKDVALIRSMTNKEGNHERAAYQLHTGYIPSGSVKHPTSGASPRASWATPGSTCRTSSASAARPSAPASSARRSSRSRSRTRSSPPATSRSRSPRERFSRRLGLLGALEKSGFAQSGGADRVRDHQAVYRQTAGMVLSPRMKAFDLEGEDPALRDAYGQNPFGQGCLLARRLVETGVTFVEVRMNGWDTHNQMKDRIGKLSGQVDPALATLITDLKNRGMLDRTLVIWMGEFGRTPRINPNAGRDHFPRVFNVALAGGGIKGGQVIGASADDGTEVKDHPVTVTDLLTTFCHSLKIDPTKENMSSVGRPIKIVDGGEVVKPLFS